MMSMLLVVSATAPTLESIAGELQALRASHEAEVRALKQELVEQRQFITSLLNAPTSPSARRESAGRALESAAPTAGETDAPTIKLGRHDITGSLDGVHIGIQDAYKMAVTADGVQVDGQLASTGAITSSGLMESTVPITAAGGDGFVMHMPGRERFSIAGRSNADNGYTQRIEMGFHGGAPPLLTMVEGGDVSLSSRSDGVPRLQVTSKGSLLMEAQDEGGVRIGSGGTGIEMCSQCTYNLADVQTAGHLGAWLVAVYDQASKHSGTYALSYPEAPREVAANSGVVSGTETSCGGQSSKICVISVPNDHTVYVKNLYSTSRVVDIAVFAARL